MTAFHDAARAVLARIAPAPRPVLVRVPVDGYVYRRMKIGSLASNFQGARR